MPRNTSFAVLYKQLLDCNFSPDPERADAALDAVLRQLSAADLSGEAQLPWELPSGASP